MLFNLYFNKKPNNQKPNNQKPKNLHFEKTKKLMKKPKNLTMPICAIMLILSICYTIFIVTIVIL